MATATLGAYPQMFQSDTTRYPSMKPVRRPSSSSGLLASIPDRESPAASGSISRSQSGVGSMVAGWANEVYEGQRSETAETQSQIQSRRQTPSEAQSANQQSAKPESSISFLPPGAQRRVVERYDLDQPSLPPGEYQRASQVTDDHQQLQQPPQLQQQYASSPRHPAVGNSGSSPARYSSSYNASLVPISPNPRAYAQHPTYITPPSAPPTAMNSVYSPAPPQQEEVCVECNMRDQDMIDVDVTTPGVWERESDAEFQDLLRREYEDEVAGVATQDPNRPKSKGGRLTESNLKMWLSVNIREPASRLQTLEKYIKAQRLLLEAEALAHARAMHESRQLDNKMRDAYSQLRRSAYDTGSSATPADDSGGVRIKTPRSASSPAASGPHDRKHSREITLLENGMIVEHVDVRKEEREEKERKRREEKRARKLSRSSGMEAGSLYSVTSNGPHLDSGVGLKPYSRYSQASSRPMSVLTAPMERQDRPPSFPRAYSQASFSDVHSMGSASPRRKFFGFPNLSAGWRSQNSLAPSGMSGSMVDMHVALQREGVQHAQDNAMHSPHSQVWPPTEQEMTESPIQLEEPTKKKKGGFKKIWRIVTGSSSKNEFASNSRDVSRSMERNEDDAPLAPPPPLSYLVNHRRDPSGPSRHQQSPSIASTSSPQNNRSSQSISPPTAPSSVLPSPVSARPSMQCRQLSNDGSRMSKYPDDDGMDLDALDGSSGSRNTVHPVTSEPDLRNRRATNTSSNGNLAVPGPSMLRPVSVVARDKSLPPLPLEAQLRPNQGRLEARPRTLFTYDPRSTLANNDQQHHSPNQQEFLPPRAPFRGTEPRRQSFGGMATRPHLAVQTMPANGGRRGGPINSQCDEFGGSRMSLADERPSTKRKSKFAFSSLLGVGSKKQAQKHEFPTLQRSLSNDRSGEDYSVPTSASRHSAFSVVGGTRMSMTSRKAIESVAQDADFVAYRYPSNGQRLDLR